MSKCFEEYDVSEYVHEVSRTADGNWQVRTGKWVIDNLTSLLAAVLFPVEAYEDDLPIVVKTDSPDYRDWELVWTAKDGFLFTNDDFFRMQLDVSTEEFYK